MLEAVETKTACHWPKSVPEVLVAEVEAVETKSACHWPKSLPEVEVAEVGCSPEFLNAQDARMLQGQKLWEGLKAQDLVASAAWQVRQKG